MEITDSTQVTLTITSLIVAGSALVSVVAAWMTLNFKVQHNTLRIDALEKGLNRTDKHVGSIERWRERTIGAASTARNQTGSYRTPNAETSDVIAAASLAQKSGPVTHD